MFRTVVAVAAIHDLSIEEPDIEQLVHAVYTSPRSPSGDGDRSGTVP